MDAQTRCKDSGSVLLLRCGGATFAFHHVDDGDDDDDDDALEVVAQSFAFLVYIFRHCCWATSCL